MSKPIYAVDDILVLKTFDGRSTYCTFLEVHSLTAAKAPKVYVLDEILEEVFTSGTASKHYVKPVLNSRTGIRMTMRWYPSREQYAFEPTYGCAFTRLSKYDPYTVYENNWLSD